MAEEPVAPGGRKRRAKRLLTPSQKYEIWLQMIRQEVTMAEAAAAAGVDRSTIVRIRQVAKDGALTALAASKPGAAGTARDAELAAAVGAFSWPQPLGDGVAERPDHSPEHNASRYAFVEPTAPLEGRRDVAHLAASEPSDGGR